MTVEWLVSILIWEVIMQALILTYVIWATVAILTLAIVSIGIGVFIVTVGQVIVWLWSAVNQPKKGGQNGSVN